MCTEMIRERAVIALCGKGGVGKTSVSALLTRLLCRDPEARVLAIDADPAVGLATALGIEVTKTIDDIRNSLIARVEKGTGGQKREILAHLDYEVFEALVERDNLAFLAIGRPETEGCYCQVNTFLKEIIESISRGFDYVLIDGEAGIEQVNRRVMERVTHLLLVSDASAKGLNVIRTIKRVADGAVNYKRAGLLLNRLRDEVELSRLSLPGEIDFLGWLPEDLLLREYDIEGRSLMELPDCPALDAAEAILTRLEMSPRGPHQHECRCGMQNS